jgi:hypothetical protein
MSLINAIVSLVVLGVKNRSVPSYSIAPASAVVKLVPDVNLTGAVPAVAVPAFIFKYAVGAVVPIPRLPSLSILNFSLPLI